MKVTVSVVVSGENWRNSAERHIVAEATPDLLEHVYLGSACEAAITEAIDEVVDIEAAEAKAEAADDLALETDLATLPRTDS
jgi:hypothetical protein